MDNPERPKIDRIACPWLIKNFIDKEAEFIYPPTPEKAAVAGDFAMLENEAKLVIKALIKNGIEVAAVYNHMVHERPHIFFLH